MAITRINVGAVVVAAFVAGAFISSPELRAYAANTVSSIDIVDGTITTTDIGDGQVRYSDIGSGAVTTSKIGNNAITSAKIVDGEVKAADIGSDAVGASELQGVSKLLYGQCTYNNNNVVLRGFAYFIFCTVPGTAIGDNIVATNNGNDCLAVGSAHSVVADTVDVYLRNTCGDIIPGAGTVSVIVYKR